MDAINTILLIVAKIGLALFAILVIARLVLIPWLWFCYDAPIRKLINDLDSGKEKLRQGAAGRGVTTGGLAAQISALERPILERLDSLKARRQLFLDRANLFLSIASIGK